MSKHKDSREGHSHAGGHTHVGGHAHEGEHSSEKDAHAHDDHGHDHGGGSHGHVHGTIDPSITATDRGLWAVKWSFVGLFITTLIQIVIFYFSGSIALLADAIHNLGDGCTAVPLGIAFILGKRKPSKRFHLWLRARGRLGWLGCRAYRPGECCLRRL